MRFAKKALFFGAAIALLGLGLLLSRCSLEQVEELRIMERIPRTQIAGLIPGEANIAGTAGSYHDQYLQAPDSGTTCFYFRYRLQARRTDAQGRTSWRTIRSDTRSVPFLVEDESGTALIRIEPEHARVSVATQQTRTVGDRRHIEERIEPGVPVFVMGYAEFGPDHVEIGFSQPGSYTPLISTRTEQEERGTAGFDSLMLTILGLVCISLSVYALTRAIGINQTLGYAGLVALAIVVALVWQSLIMISNDLEDAHLRLNAEDQRRSEVVADILDGVGVPWETGNWQALTSLVAVSDERLSGEARSALVDQRVALARSILRVERIRDRFPERLVARRMDLPMISRFDLTETERDRLEEYEIDYVPTRLAGLPASIMAGVGLLLTLVCGGVGMHKIKRKRWIENIPTVSTKGVVYGVNEIKGEVVVPEGQEPLYGPLSGQPCSYYHYLVEEKRGSGKKSSWVTIEDDRRGQKFFCRDKEGDIEVDPEASDVICRTRSARKKSRRRYTEKRLPVGAKAYVLGNAVVDPQSHDHLVIAGSDDKTMPFIVSDYSEDELIARKATVGFLLINLGLNGFMLIGLSLTGFMGDFGPTAFLAAAITPVLYLMALVLVLMYNDMVFLRRRCNAMWGNIDVALKRRFDLLPRLVDIAKAYLEHERDVQQQLSRLRSSGSQLTSGEAETMSEASESVMSQLVGVVEAHPDLKANETMSDLMRRVRDIEDDVAFIREGYTHAVEIYNTRIRRFPEVIMAGALGFRAQSFLNA